MQEKKLNVYLTIKKYDFILLICLFTQMHKKGVAYKKRKILEYKIIYRYFCLPILIFEKELVKD